jgi:hypothetical protein
MMQAAAPVSVMAHASTSGKPNLVVHAGTETPAHVVRAIGRGGGCGQQHRGHHAQVVDDRRAAVAYALPPAFRVEAIELDQAAAGGDDHHRGKRHRVHVVQRQGRDDAFRVGAHGRDAVQRGVPLAGAQEVFVEEAAALGPAGRARRVQQRALGGEAWLRAERRGR